MPETTKAWPRKDKPFRSAVPGSAASPILADAAPADSRSTSRLSSPHLCLVERRYAMHHFMAAARDARQLIGFDRRQEVRIGVVCRAFFKRARPKMTVQAFAVVVRLVQLDVFWRGRRR